MITGLDHVVALVRDIGAAKAAYQTLLGRAPAWQNSGEGADRVLFTPDRSEVAGELARRARPGDLVITMGAGDVTALGPVILAALARTEARR